MLTFCQVSDPPDTVGVLGAVRSIRTVFAWPADAGAQLDVLPAASTVWNWAIVSPSVVTVTDAPAEVGDQVTPPSVDVRYW